LYPDEFSREALLKKMSERAQGLLSYSEFSGAIATFGRDYMAGTKELLADLYDSPDLYTRVVGANTYTLRNVCLSILGASQTDWLVEKLKAGDVRGGFLARFTYWPAFEKRRFIAIPPDPDVALGNKLLRGLNELRQISGVASLPASVLTKYTHWLERHEQSLNGERASDLSPFWTRLSVTCLKFAILLQLSADRSLVISVDSLERAIGLTEFLKASLHQLFEDEFAIGKDMQERQRVLRAIQRHPGISQRDLMRSASLLKVKFDQIIATLLAEGRIDKRDGTYFAEASSQSVPVSDWGTDTDRPRIYRAK
jgi:hypothetical protein